MSFLRKRLGLTLIELLIALSIFVIAVVPIYAVFRTGIISWRRIEEYTSGYQQVKFATEMMAQNLRQAIFYPDIKFEGKSDSLTFMSLVSSPSEEYPHKKELAKITYYLKQEEGINNLLQETILYRNLENPEESKPKAILTNLSEFKFSYCYKKEGATGEYIWQDNFDGEDILPKLVRIKFKPGAPLEDFETTKYVYIPTGELLEEE